VKQANRITDKPKKGLQRGVAAVELAIILPLFGLLVLGVIEIGGFARDHQVLQNAAREGARFSAMPNNRKSLVSAAEATAADTRIKNHIIAYLANEGITVPAANITVNQNYTITAGATTIGASEITVDYTRPVLFPGINSWVPLSATVRGKAVFRNFY
jgi:Flp pilus assembly protein TadG